MGEAIRFDLPDDPGVTLPEGASNLENLARHLAAGRDAAVGGLSRDILKNLLHGWHLQARTAQKPPADDWQTWLILAGRGFGKTRAGAEWVRERAACDPRVRIALVAATLAEGRAVMIEGGKRPLVGKIAIKAISRFRRDASSARGRNKAKAGPKRWRSRPFRSASGDQSGPSICCSGAGRRSDWKRRNHGASA